MVGATGFEPATPCDQVAHYAISRNSLQHRPLQVVDDAPVRRAGLRQPAMMSAAEHQGRCAQNRSPHCDPGPAWLKEYAGKSDPATITDALQLASTHIAAIT